MICWQVGHIVNIRLVYGMFGCPPGAVGARKFGALWQPVAGCGIRLDAPKEEIGDIDA